MRTLSYIVKAFDTKHKAMKEAMVQDGVKAEIEIIPPPKKR